jgi:hypothetical protein
MIVRGRESGVLSDMALEESGQMREVNAGIQGGIALLSIRHDRCSILVCSPYT